ncbi:hypothetical protein EDD21DRAFT_230915 [Dissophora ornata]|nr:hypothetical protein EDD21DRAFT_230915 [Dissophora ornata]
MSEHGLGTHSGQLHVFWLRVFLSPHLHLLLAPLFAFSRPVPVLTLPMAFITANCPSSRHSVISHLPPDSVPSSPSSPSFPPRTSSIRHLHSSNRIAMSSTSSDSEKHPGLLRPDLQQPSRNSRVLIAGGGFGGLLLAIFMERLGIPYYLFDGGSKAQHLGAALGVGPTVLPVFEQLGLTSLLASISLPFPTVELFDSKLKKLGVLAIKVQTEEYVPFLLRIPRLRSKHSSVCCCCCCCCFVVICLMLMMMMMMVSGCMGCIVVGCSV